MKDKTTIQKRKARKSNGIETIFKFIQEQEGLIDKFSNLSPELLTKHKSFISECWSDFDSQRNKKETRQI